MVSSMDHPLKMFRHCPSCGSGDFIDNDEKSRRCRQCGFVYFLNPSSANVAFITDSQGRLLVERRDREPAKGTLDLPGGFADIGETAEEGVAREVAEETGLHVIASRYLFSIPNTYLYSGLTIPTLDLFFACEVDDIGCLTAGDDAAECLWVTPEELHPDDFGLLSIREGVRRWKERH